MSIDYLKEEIDRFAQTKKSNIESFEKKLDELFKKIAEELARNES